MPLVTQMWMFASPVVYPVSLVPEKWRMSLQLEPDGGSHRGIPMGASGDGRPKLWGNGVECHYGSCASRLRDSLLQSSRTNLCGRDLTFIVALFRRIFPFTTESEGWDING